MVKLIFVKNRIFHIKISRIIPLVILYKSIKIFLTLKLKGLRVRAQKKKKD